MPSTSDPAGEAFDELVVAIGELGDLVRHPERGAVTAGDRAGGYLYATELLRLSLDLYADADGDDPRFVPFSTPTPYHAGTLAVHRIQGGVNPDGLYDFTVLRPDRAYRVTGRRGNDCYLSLSFSGGTDGERPTRTAATFNDRQIAFAPDGTFEVVISADERPGNWVRMEPDICSMIVRQYFDVTPALRRPAELHIDVLGDAPRSDPAADGARRLRAAAAFIRSTSESFPMTSGREANTFGEPLGYTGSAGALGTTDNTYCMGTWRLEPGQQLVVETTPPPAGYWSLQAWNHWGQSLSPTVDEGNYAHQIINSTTAELGPDGSVRLVLSDERRGEPNWLDTFGWTQGSLIYRTLYPEAAPTAPICSVK
jgi:hypothetical protein